MKPCINPEIGRLLTSYELDALSPDDAHEFEVHLLDCDFCLHELEAAHEVSRRLARNSETIRAHYSRTGEDFAREIASLSELPHENASRTSVTFGIAYVAAWLRAGASRLVIVPAVAVAAIAVVLVMNRTPIQYVEHQGNQDFTSPNTEQTHETDTDDKGSSTYRQLDSLQERVESSKGEASGRSLPDEVVKQPLALSAHLRAVLPVAAIPFQSLTTRGTSSDSNRDSDSLNQDSVFRKGMELYVAGDYVASSVLLKRVVNQHPRHAKAWKYLGSASYMNGSYDEAREAFARCSSYSGESVDLQVRLYLAASLIYTHRTAEAVPLLKSLRISPDKLVAQASDEILLHMDEQR